MTVAIVLIFGVLSFFMVAPAHAYIDASSGSMILQMLLGGIAGGLIAFKYYGRKLWGFLRRSSKDKGNRSDSEN